LSLGWIERLLCRTKVIFAKKPDFSEQFRLHYKGATCMKTQLICAAVLAGLVASPALAQEVKPPPVNAVDLSCGDLEHALRSADAGKNPSAARKRSAEEAQDDIAMGLAWVHGYRSAKRGSAMGALTPVWMETELRSILTSCRARSPDGKLTILSVIEP
jgi:hypothetical protein